MVQMLRLEDIYRASWRVYALCYLFVFVKLASGQPQNVTLSSVMVTADQNHKQYQVIEDQTIADEMYRKIRVLCWVMTRRETHRSRADHVKATWGKRCNILLFMSTSPDAKLPTVQLPVKEGKEYLWGKTKAAFKYAYEHYRHDADWFLKADDDTYVIVENLRYMLSEYNPKDPIYLGCRYKQYTEQGYMSGGAGYVLSKEAVSWFVNKGLPSPKLCFSGDYGVEDLEMGKCLENIGVKAMDSRDSLQRGRFFPFHPEDHMFNAGSKAFWYGWYTFYPEKTGLQCCSDYAITFHYIKATHMYTLDYLLYQLRPYGITQKYIPITASEGLKVAKTKGTEVGSGNEKRTAMSNWWGAHEDIENFTKLQELIESASLTTRSTLLNKM